MIYIFAAMIIYTVAILFSTIASRNTDITLVNAILNTVSAIVPVGLFFALVNKTHFQSSKLGIVMSIIAGVGIALFGLALAKSYTVNKVAIVVPIVFGGAIFLSAILSAIFLKEKITTLQLIGLFFLGIGLAFIIYARTTNS
jgi:uncharacterized membrane protein